MSLEKRASVWECMKMLLTVTCWVEIAENYNVYFIIVEERSTIAGHYKKLWDYLFIIQDKSRN